jgi:hypothetical protein
MAHQVEQLVVVQFLQQVARVVVLVVVEMVVQVVVHLVMVGRIALIVVKLQEAEATEPLVGHLVALEEMPLLRVLNGLAITIIALVALDLIALVLLEFMHQAVVAEVEVVGQTQLLGAQAALVVLVHMVLVAMALQVALQLEILFKPL